MGKTYSKITLATIGIMLFMLRITMELIRHAIFSMSGFNIHVIGIMGIQQVDFYLNSKPIYRYYEGMENQTCNLIGLG